jgi:hypothetical protein
MSRYVISSSVRAVSTGARHGLPGALGEAARIEAHPNHKTGTYWPRLKMGNTMPVQQRQACSIPTLERHSSNRSAMEDAALYQRNWCPTSYIENAAVSLSPTFAGRDLTL